jgi:ribosomal protein L21
MFVAGFIGSPTMDFVDGTIEKADDGIYFVFGNSKVKVPEGRTAALVDGDYIGKAVTMGVRAENIHDEEVYLSSSPDSVVEAEVEVVELMGSETLLYLNIEGASFIAKVDPRSTAKVGDKINLDVMMVVDGDKVTNGNPLVKDAEVIAEVLEQGKEDKVVVFKYKAKKNYRRKQGHRQPFTALKIVSVK